MAELKPKSTPHGGQRKGSGRKPQVIRDLVSSWKSDTTSVDLIMTRLKELATGVSSTEIDDKGNPKTVTTDGAVMVAAAREYLNRVLGKPKQQIEMKVENADLKDLYRGVLQGLKTGELEELLEHSPLPPKTSAKPRKRTRRA